MSTSVFILYDDRCKISYLSVVMFDPRRGFVSHGEYWRLLSITHLNDDFYYAILEYILEF